jgi:uncharacterized protein Smg (DUF494 family)
MEHLRNRLRDLLLLLLEAMDARQQGEETAPEEVRAMITAAGYDEDDLQELLTWLQGRWQPEDGGPSWLSSRQVGQASADALRQPGPREDEILEPAAFGYLLGLVRTRQITSDQMESLIQYAQLAPGGPLSVGDVSMLIDRVVLQTPDTPAPRPGPDFGRAH